MGGAASWWGCGVVRPPGCGVRLCIRCWLSSQPVPPTPHRVETWDPTGRTIFLGELIFKTRYHGVYVPVILESQPKEAVCPNSRSRWTKRS